MQQLCFLSNLSSADWAAWAQAIGTIGAVVAAILITRQQAIAAKRHEDDARADRQKDCWTAIRAEVEVCGKMAADFTDARIAAPSYRLPTVAYNKILHELLLVARLNAADAQGLLFFFTDVEAVNRGLDIAQEMHRQGNIKAFEEQTSVNFNRAGKHVRPGGDHYEAAMAVIERHTAIR